MKYASLMYTPKCWIMKLSTEEIVELNDCVGDNYLKALEVANAEHGWELVTVMSYPNDPKFNKYIMKKNSH